MDTNASLQKEPSRLQSRLKQRVRLLFVKVLILPVSMLMYVIFITHSVAFAGVNPDMCSLYSASVDFANSINKDNAFNLQGPRWTSNGVQSSGWCSGAKIESVADEAVGRLQDLNGHSHDAMCKQYINDVVAANRINADTGCGFSGPDFNPKIVDHENWCRGAKPDEVYSEERHRFMSMDHCTTCEFYASEAERYRGIQKVKGCKLSGPRWSNSKSADVSWCMQARLSSVMDEQNARANEAASCTSK